MPAGVIRCRSFDGTYAVVFEREFASLEQIEAIRWERPEIQYTGTQGEEPGLPAGCGFEVERITYDSASRSYTVELRTGQQHLGDVAAYQAQVDALTGELARQKRETAQWQADSASRSYTVELRTGQQHLGDVAAYQAQVDALTGELARQKRETAQWQAAAAEKDAALADRENVLAALQADSTAAAETELRAAYQEGVESYG